VFGLNIDTIEIVQTSTQNPAALKAAADRIAENVPTIRYDEKNKRIALLNSTTHQVDSFSYGNLSEGSFQQLQKQSETFNALKAQLNNGAFSIGYKDFSSQWKNNWFWKIIGMILTVLALQVGSTYWFDMLNKVVNLRGTGKKPVSTKTDKK
jgi:hypothetical protein